MTAVVENAFVDKLVAALVPPAGIYMRDTFARFGGERFLSQTGESGSAAAEVIEPRELGESTGLCPGDFLQGKSGRPLRMCRVRIDIDGGAAAVGRNISRGRNRGGIGEALG